MQKRLLQIYGDSCARNIIFQIIVITAALGLFIIPALIAVMMGGNRDTNFKIFMGILIVVMLAVVVGVVFWSINSIRKRARQLDSVFEHWHLKGEAYLQNGRQYRGEIKGRKVEIKFHRGPTLEIKVATSLQARAVVLYKSEIGRFSAGLGNYESVPISDPTFHNLSVFSQDKFWMSKIMEDKQARKAVRQLMGVTSAYELRKVLLQSGAIQLTIRRLPFDEINHENVSQWIEDLFTLLRMAEKSPPPQAPTEEIDINFETDPDQVERKSIVILAAAAGCSALVGVAFCVLAISLVTFLVNTLPLR